MAALGTQPFACLIPSAEERLERIFPALREIIYTVVAEADVKYNRIAWVAGVDDDWWDPVDETRYWPAGAPRGDTVEIVMEGLATAGYEPCTDDTLEPGIEKIALYEYRGEFTHVAKQLASGLWSSKLGREWLIEHELEALTDHTNFGPQWRYGEVVAFMARARRG